MDDDKGCRCLSNDYLVGAEILADTIGGDGRLHDMEFYLHLLDTLDGEPVPVLRHQGDDGKKDPAILPQQAQDGTANKKGDREGRAQEGQGVEGATQDG